MCNFVVKYSLDIHRKLIFKALIFVKTLKNHLISTINGRKHIFASHFAPKKHIKMHSRGRCDERK